jgi:hypothetical protein
VRRVDVSLADLAAREDVGAIGLLSLRVLDPVHVRSAHEVSEAPGRVTFPDAATVGTSGEADDRLRVVDAAIVLRDVASRRIAEHHLDLLRVGRPHRESQTGRGAGRREMLVGAEPPQMREIVALHLRRSGLRPETELSVPLRRTDILNLGRNAPEAGALRPVEPDAPLEGARLVCGVEND